MKAASRDRRERGLPSTARLRLRPFGYELDGITHRPAEAAALREAYDALIVGSDFVEIANRWNRAGFRNAFEQPWTAGAVSGVIWNPRQMGKVAYGGRIVADAVWEPMVDEITWRVIRARSKHRAIPARSLLGHIATCGKVLEDGTACGRVVSTGRQNGRPAYRCLGPTQHLTRRTDLVDAQVTKWVLARLARPSVQTRLTEGDRALAATHAQLARLRARELVEEGTAVPPADFGEVLAPIRAEIRELEERVVRTRLRTLIGRQLVSQTATEAWDGWSILERRQVIGAVAVITIASNPPARTPYCAKAVKILPRR